MKKLFYGLLCVVLISAISCQKNDNFINEDNSPNSSTELSEQQVQDLLFSYIQKVENGNPLTRSKSPSITNISKEYHKSQNIATRASANNSEIPIYTINLNCDNHPGFAIVIGDKRIPAVLAYSPNGDLSKLKNADGGGIQSYIDNIPVVVDAMIMQYNSITFPDEQHKFTSFLDGPDLTPDYTHSWTDEDGTIQEFHNLHETIIWEQDAPYNEALPYCTFRQQHYLVGCSALALANVMAYKKYPPLYDWDLITNGLALTIEDSKAKKDEVTGFLRDLYLATNSRYDSINNVTLANENDIYNGILLMGYSCNPTAYWNLEEIGKSIKRNHPVWMGATCKNELTAHAHAFVVRGWWKFKLPTQTNTEYGVSLAVNWGNNYGFGNGWYLVQYEEMDVNAMGLAPLYLNDDGRVYAKHDYKYSFRYFLNLRPDGEPLE